MIDPARIPSFASASNNACCRGSYASPAMKRATVKPMPLSIHTLANAFHELPLGRRTSFVRMASQEKENTPRNFPSTRLQHYGKSDTREQVVETHALERYSSVGESKNRDNHKAYRRVKVVLHVLQRADDVVGRRFNLLQHIHLPVGQDTRVRVLSGDCLLRERRHALAICSTDFSTDDFIVAGMQKASATPAIVAWIPELSTAYQSADPIVK